MIMLVVISLMILNYSRLTGTEYIKTIHAVTLLVMGAAFGVLLVNVISLFREE
jgi:hypothetical protein